MKRILFHNPSTLILNVILIAIAFTACKKQSADLSASGITEEVATAKSGGKPGTTTEVPLRLSISDAAGNKITSDGGGDYVNGSQNMRLVFDQYGNLIFDNKLVQGKPAQRFYNTNLDNPLQVVIDPGFTTGTGNYMATTSSGLSSFTAIQNMTVGTPQCITFHGGAGNNFVFSFHGGAEDISTSPTSFATITRNSATEWVMTPGSCSVSANSDVAALRLSGTLYGYYHLPFSFTFTKL